MIDEILDEWHFVRSETLELFHALNDQQLQFTPPGDKWQPLFYQFACIGRTQVVYTKALQTGVMDIAYFSDEQLPNKHEHNTQAKLQKLLAEADEAFGAAAKVVSHVAWPDRELSTVRHIAKLISHERLHHGQLISYFTLAGIDLPYDFKQNWAL